MDDARILIADDQPAIIELFISALEETGKNYVFYKALHGKSAVEIAMEILPDLLIIDWEMPVMNGIEAIRELKKNEKTLNIPIIVSTGVMTSSHNLKTALEAGAIDFIRKPVDKTELQARVRSVLLFVYTQRLLIEQKEKLLQAEAEKLKSELEFKSRELISNALYISKYSQRFNNLLDQVKMLYPFLNQTGNKTLEKIIAENSTEINTSFWPDFELHFEEIHPGFFRKLNEMCPSLSINERKLCAYIRLGMSTKDIATISYQNPQSINVSRSRIRTKLNIDRDDNLAILLRNL